MICIVHDFYHPGRSDGTVIEVSDDDELDESEPTAKTNALAVPRLKKLKRCEQQIFTVLFVIINRFLGNNQLHYPKIRSIFEFDLCEMNFKHVFSIDFIFRVDFQQPQKSQCHHLQKRLKYQAMTLALRMKMTKIRQQMA